MVEVRQRPSPALLPLLRPLLLVTVRGVLPRRLCAGRACPWHLLSDRCRTGWRGHGGRWCGQHGSSCRLQLLG